MRYQDALESVVAAIDRVLARYALPRRRVYIANPHAGTRHRHRRTVAFVRHALTSDDKALTPSDGAETDGAETVSVVWTAAGDEAIAAVESEARRADPSNPTLIVTLGGDGTHNYALRAGIDAADRLMFLRVPLGSGNDSGPSASLTEFFDGLAAWDGVTPSPRWIPAVEVVSAGPAVRPAYAAFNIASIGIDAFITAMHDRWRAILPGNTYRLLVNLAVLRYETIVDLQPIGVRLIEEGGGTVDLGKAVRMLIAFGVTGHRTYGDHMNVLPGEENLCILGYAGLLDKLRMKRLFYQGKHVDEAITSMHRAREIVLSYEKSLPLQMDGEAIELAGDDFPVTLRVRERAVRIIDPSETHRSAPPR